MRVTACIWGKNMASTSGFNGASAPVGMHAGAAKNGNPALEPISVDAAPSGPDPEVLTKMPALRAHMRESFGQIAFFPLPLLPSVDARRADPKALAGFAMRCNRPSLLPGPGP